jgi:hypothetical protein
MTTMVPGLFRGSTRWLAAAVLMVACCGALAQHRYHVAISSAPFDMNVWVECEGADALDAIVTSADPTVHQVKICVGSEAAADAITDQMLHDWYGSGLNVVFSVLGSGPGGPRYANLMNRAVAFERHATNEALRSGLVGAPPRPERRPNPFGRAGMDGPLPAFGSPSGLQGFEMNMPGGPALPAGAMFPPRLINFPAIGAPWVSPLPPLPAGVRGIAELMLAYAYGYDAFPQPLRTLGADADRYQPSARVFPARYMFAVFVVGELEEAAKRQAAPPRFDLWEAGLLVYRALLAWGHVPGGAGSAAVAPPAPNAPQGISAFAPLSTPAWWWPKQYHGGCGPGSGCSMHQPPRDPPSGGVGM